MEIMQELLVPIVNLDILLLIALGTFAGIVVGAIPGLSVTMALTLLLPLTYTWDLQTALPLMMGIYFGGVFGGSRASVLINMPGSPASVATTFDGYPMTQRGEAGMALSLTTIASAFGGVMGVIFLATAAPLIALFAINFGPKDYLIITLIGLLLIGSLSKGSMARGIFIASLGVIIGLVGIDPLYGTQRFTFGSLTLMSGVNFITAILGLFGLSEVFYQLVTLNKNSKIVNIEKVIIPPLRLIIKFLPLKLRVSILGIFVGALPGVGAEIAALLAYDHAKQTVKKPTRPFGEGAYEGVIAPEASNNAALGGSMTPMLTLGIPGDAATAIFIGALFIHGLQPGPLLMTNSSDLFWLIVSSSFLANIFLLIFGLLMVNMFVRVVTIRKQILLPIITLISIIGAYGINNNIADVFWMLFFGVVGFFLKVNKFSVAPMVLGIILGPILDVSFRRAFMSAENSLFKLIISLFSSPITAILTLFFLFALFSQTSWFNQLKRKFFKGTVN